MLHGHGSDQYRYAEKIQADFSSNVWYEGFPNQLIEVIQQHVPQLVHYPEAEAESLQQQLADLHKVSTSNIIVGNGTAELFYLLAQAYRGANSKIVVPAFAEYEDACTVHEHNISFCNYTEIDNTELTDMLWLGNPNNPDGNTISPEEILALCARNPKTIFVVDEAYAELCFSFRSSINLVLQTHNLIVLHSLTKTFAMPGLRLGYAVGASEIIQKLASIRIPWSVNSLAIAAGCYIVKNYQQLLPSKKQIATESLAFHEQLSQISALEINTSSSNFFLLKIKHGTAAQLKKYLITAHGILIRDASNFRQLTPQHFRVSLQKKEHNELLIEALTEYCSKLNT